MAPTPYDVADLTRVVIGREPGKNIHFLGQMAEPHLAERLSAAMRNLRRRKRLSKHSMPKDDSGFCREETSRERVVPCLPLVSAPLRPSRRRPPVLQLTTHARHRFIFRWAGESGNRRSQALGMVGSHTTLSLAMATGRMPASSDREI